MASAQPAARDEPAVASLDRALDLIGEIILGKPQVIRLAVTCLLARGHLLIEDLPGMGKTTLAHAIASVMGLGYQRLQFTSDLLPADILGSAVYDRENAAFRFLAGPIFHHLILADEINRATPKTQSALLEAMEEHQVTVEGETRPLPEPFFVIATQNPVHHVGTFPLPESQLDRFLMRLHLGYPDRDAERALLGGDDRRTLVSRLPAVLEPMALLALQAKVAAIHVSGHLLDYVQALLAHSRESGLYRHGLSPRAGLGVLRAARAWALMEGREFVLPEDVQAVLPAVVEHRLVAGEDALGRTGDARVADLLDAVPLPP